MHDDDDDALVRYAWEVRKLLDLYRRAHVNLDRGTLRDLNLQIFLVDAMTQVAIMPVRRADENGGAE